MLGMFGKKVLKVTQQLNGLINMVDIWVSMNFFGIGLIVGLIIGLLIMINCKNRNIKND